MEFTNRECEIIFEMIDMLSGGSPENCFAWDGTDDPSNEIDRTMAKLFIAAGEDIPEELAKQAQTSLAKDNKF